MNQDSTLPFYLENGFASQAYGFEHIAQGEHAWKSQWNGVPNSFRQMGLSENVGYIPNEIAIFHRDNDQQNHWL